MKGTTKLKLQTLELLRQYSQTRSPSIKQEILALNYNLCRSIAQRHADTPPEQRDLTQIGAIGLSKAVDRFELDKDYAFSSYAVPLIQGEIRHWLRDHPDHLSGIRIPRPLQDAKRFVEKTQRELAALGRDLSLPEVAKRCLINNWEEVDRATQPGLVSSCDARDYDDIADGTNEEQEQIDSTMAALQSLPQRQQAIVKAHFIQGKSENAIARQYDIPKLAVKAILSQSIKTLQASLL